MGRTYKVLIPYEKIRIEKMLFSQFGTGILITGTDKIR
jgi:hypothetical protein